MNDTLIYRKTDAGQLEVRTRRLNLPQRLRAMLIMIDGIKPAVQLREAATTLGVQEDFATTLLEHGLIELDPRFATVDVQVPDEVAREPAATDSERLRALQKYVNDAAVDLLGLRAFGFTLKLEKCFSTSDVLELLPDLVAQVGKRKGPEKARELDDQARRIARG